MVGRGSTASTKSTADGTFISRASGRGRRRPRDGLDRNGVGVRGRRRRGRPGGRRRTRPLAAAARPRRRQTQDRRAGPGTIVTATDDVVEQSARPTTASPEATAAAADGSYLEPPDASRKFDIHASAGRDADVRRADRSAAARDVRSTSSSTTSDARRAREEGHEGTRRRRCVCEMGDRDISTTVDPRISATWTR
jgi:hypothetical protein